MINRDDIEKLAGLSMLKLSSEEIDQFQGEIDAILLYVSEIRDLAARGQVAESTGPKNVLREDAISHEPGIYRDILLNEAPFRQGNYIKVKKILP